MSHLLQIVRSLWFNPDSVCNTILLLLHRRRSTKVNQTLHDMWPSPELVHYIYAFSRALARWRNFAKCKIHLWVHHRRSNFERRLWTDQLTSDNSDTLHVGPVTSLDTVFECSKRRHWCVRLYTAAMAHHKRRAATLCSSSKTRIAAPQ